MIAFSVVAILFLAAALLFVLPPLLDRQLRPGVADSAQASAFVLREHLAELDAELAAGAIGSEQHRAARDDLERRILEDARVPAAGSLASGGIASAERSVASQASPGRRWTALAVGIAVPVLAASIYAWIGSPAALDPTRAQQNRDARHELTREQIVAMVGGLDQKLAASPNDLDGWTMLARSRNVLGEYAAAARAYSRAVEIRPSDPQLLADYADTLAMANGRRLAGEPRSLIERALALDPRNAKALALAGSAAFEARDYPRAIALWERLIVVAGDGSDVSQSVRNSIADARRRMNITSTGTAPRPGADAAGAGLSLTGTVRIDPSIAAKVRPEDTVFVYARAANGPRMPLAIVRIRVADLPYGFTLDESMSMNPATPLSNAGSLVVIARVSRSGTAAAAPGDFEGSSVPVTLGAGTLEVRIDRAL